MTRKVFNKITAGFDAAPGWDWVVMFRWEDGEPEAMSVFGVMTIEEATREARYSLGDPADDPAAPGYEILSIRRAEGLDLRS